MKINIKTSEQIANLYGLSNIEINKKWVAVDAMKKELREFGKLIGNN